MFDLWLRAQFTILGKLALRAGVGLPIVFAIVAAGFRLWLFLALFVAITVIVAAKALRIEDELRGEGAIR